ncbi:hypothetical protein M405DRAFT_502336 [Rhizopogon salebrosus TDB-379]|nr:hypothetical protein M405DRAFT_502336 [Rhizopogon salebrosus TDB-379]
MFQHFFCHASLADTKRVVPHLCQTSRRKNRHPTAASDNMDGFLDDPPQRPPAHSSSPPDHSTAHRSPSLPPPEHRPRQNPSSPPSEHRSLLPPPHERSCPPPSPQPSNRRSSGSVQDEELTPPPATPSPKCVRRGRRATRRKR